MHEHNMLEQILATFIGAILAFAFAFILFIIKDRRDNKHAKSTSIYILKFFISELVDKIDQDPEYHLHISLSDFTSYVPHLLKDDKTERCFNVFNKIYTHWKTGNHLVSGPRHHLINEDRERIKELLPLLD